MDMEGNEEQDDQGQLGGETGADTSTNTDPEPVIEITMEDGSVKELTRSEIQKQLVESAERVRGAGKKFEEAAKIRKEAEYHKRIVNDFTAAQQGDTEALKRLATYRELGITEEAIAGIISQQSPKRGQVNSDGEGEQGDERAPQSAMSEEDRRALEDLRREQQERRRDQIVDAAMKVVDKDASLCNIISADNSGQRREAARRFVEEAIRRRVHAGERGTSVLNNVANDLKQHLRTWGALGMNRSGAQDQDSEPFSEDELPDALAGIDFDSAATGTRGGVHRTQSPPKRVSSLDPGYSGHLKGRLAELFKTGRS